jgi:hypothetical protein
MTNITTLLTDITLTGDVRACVSFMREHGEPVDDHLALWLSIADLLELPDDTMFLPAVSAAIDAPTQLMDPASVAHTAKIATAAGYGSGTRNAARRRRRRK